MHKLLAPFVALLFVGCAAAPQKSDPRDPWERFNRASFAFNDRLDRAIARPAAKAYKKVTPRFVRTGISNALSNLNSPTTIVNDLLQGKFGQAGRDTGRFLLNSTLGLGGLLDPATSAGLDQNDEDFGQTLGAWGLQSGPYLMIPFLGPSTVRDALARFPDQFTYPVNYLEDDSTRYIIRGVEFLDLRAGLLDLDEQLAKSYDRYAFVRNAWMQRREFKVKDGNVPETDLDSELELQDDAADAPAKDEAAPNRAPADGTAQPAPPPGS
jgi:phospholipid-binding lipoprotein MlaA